MVDVVFRKDKGEVVAVLPGLSGGPGKLTCYTNREQHSSCSYPWYQKTKPAPPEEYAPLLKELQGNSNYEVRVVRYVPRRAWISGRQ
jgi:hypothetical protein